MKVFVAGATGILGKRVVSLLVQQGHTVVGLSRSAANAAWLRQNGAEARQGDLFNQAQIQALTADCQAVLHLATAIPTKSRTTPADWALNDRIRREGTQILVNAAVQNQCQLYVQQSVTFVYGDRSGAWVDESAPLNTPLGAVLQSAKEMEGIVQTAVTQHALPAIILRCGSFYSADSAQTTGMLPMLQKGFFPIVGDGTPYWNNIHADDAASAVVTAVTRFPQGIGQTYHVCDDEPVTYGDLIAYLAQKVNGRQPFHLPVWLAKPLIGSHAVEFLLASVRCRNQKIKEQLGWTPQYPTYREGYSATIAQWQATK